MSGVGPQMEDLLNVVYEPDYILYIMQDKDGEGAKELEEFHSERMKVVQLDVCSDDQVKKAVEYIKGNLEDSQRGNVNSLLPLNTDK